MNAFPAKNRTRTALLTTAAVLVNFFLCRYLLDILPMRLTGATHYTLHILTAFTALTFFRLAGPIWRDFLSIPRAKPTAFLFTLYVAFAFSGNGLFLYPLTMPLSVPAFAAYLLTTLWLLPASLLLLYIIHRASRSRGDAFHPAARKTRTVFLRSFLLCALAWGLCLIAFNPAISSHDTAVQYAQAYGNVPLSNAHPIFHTLALRHLLAIADHPSFIVVGQCLFFAAVWSAAVAFLHAKGLSARVAAVGTAIFALSPNDALHMVTIWKDIPYAASLLWLTLLCAKTVIDPQKYLKSTFHVVQWTTCLVFVCLFRHNGVVPYVVTAFGILLLVRLSPRTCLAIAISLVAIFLFRGPVFEALNVHPDPSYAGFKYLALGNDILSVRHNRGNFPPETRDAAARIVRQNHQPAHFDPYRTSLRYDTAISTGTFVELYARLFIANPLLMTRSALCRTDCGWNLFMGKDAYINQAGYTGQADKYAAWTEHSPPRRENALTRTFTAWTAVTLKQPLHILFWRLGAATILLLASAAVLIVQSRAHLLPTLLPWAGQSLSLLLSAAYMDYRYYWPAYPIALFVLLLTLTPTNGGKPAP